MRILLTLWYKNSPANANGNAQQRRIFESPVRTKSKLTHPSNDVSFTLVRQRQTAQPVVLSRIGLTSQTFPTPSHLAPFSNLWKNCTDYETGAFQAVDGEDLAILAC